MRTLIAALAVAIPCLAAPAQAHGWFSEKATQCSDGRAAVGMIARPSN